MLAERWPRAPQTLPEQAEVPSLAAPGPEAPAGLAAKIMPLTRLALILAEHQAQGRRVAHCHGCFDLLHIGHVRHLEQAKGLGDVLVVTITPDHYVDKGPHRPAFPQALRAEALAALACVDYVAINQWPTAEDTLRLLKPNVYVKGSEFKEIVSDRTGKIAGEAGVCREIGATIAFTEDIVFSSSNLINRYFSSMPDDVNRFLETFRAEHGLAQVLKVMDDMASLRVLVIGDAIIDDYQYGEVIGRSSKDPVLAFKYRNNETMAGGVLAVANHVANFAGSVDLVTVLGETDSHEDFIRARLHPRINPHFIIKPGAPTIVKRRFIDGYSLSKLLEVYVMDCAGPLPEQNLETCRWLEKELAGYDLVIASDFGHGAITGQMVGTLTERAPFLSVNTQANAGNRGFHTISRYRRADYACLAEHEMRLEMRDPTGDLPPMLETVGRRLCSRQLVVTRGSKGCMIRSADGGISTVPGFSHKVVDRVGAGDAFLSVTSLAAVQGVNEAVLGFIGNVVGSRAVEIVGNSRAIDRQAVEKFVVALLK
jgi:rfaE bifunctional protein nucleotidyltransferase chain/domain